MPHEELLGWFSYFAQRPVGWRDDLRTYRFLQTQGTKEKPEKIFASLVPIFAPKEGREEGYESMLKSPFVGKMMQSKGGKQLEL